MRSPRLVMGLIVLLAAAVALAGCHYKLPPHPKMERYGPDAGWKVSKADRAGYTVHMVEKALRLYEAKGREATIAHYNSPESVDGEWYVFIADENEELIAHPNPDILGHQARRPDLRLRLVPGSPRSLAARPHQSGPLRLHSRHGRSGAAAL